MMSQRLSSDMTAGELLNEVRTALVFSGDKDADADARLIMEKVLMMDMNRFIMSRDEKYPQEVCDKIEAYLNQRLSGKPMQYVLGEAWFFCSRFHVEPGVLIPRFDTEVLVEETLKKIRPGMKVLDLCTGSGCIIITLAKEADIDGTGSDISDKALEVARLNNERLSAGCRFIKSDLFSDIDGRFDLIVSNPPYVRTDDIKDLQREIRDHEPAEALDGGQDGLDFYRRIASETPGHLEKEGFLFLEIGYDQADAVSDILNRAGFGDISVVKDLGDNDRVIIAEMRS